MKKFNPTKILVGFLGLATFASLVGSVSGSLAWYAYSARASLSYTGTSIERASQLQIGVVSKEAIDFDPRDMEEDTTIVDAENNHYYFAPLGSGITSLILNKYLDSNGFASDYLIPVTSGSFNDGDSGMTLKKAPNADEGNIKNNDPAPKLYYANLQLIFRVPKNSYSTITEYLPDYEIWLTDATSKRSTAQDGDVFKSLRIFVDRLGSYTSDFILNPSASAAGETKVGGLLDLGKDGKYDHDGLNNEVIYGEYDETIAPSKITPNYQGVPGDEGPIDVNESGSTVFNSFTARHAEGVNYYTKESLAECGIKTAKYLSLNDVAPVRHPITGDMSNPAGKVTSLCKTDASDYNLARVNMLIYLEGWDFSVVDEEIGHLFDVGLTFEINKVPAND